MSNPTPENFDDRRAAMDTVYKFLDYFSATEPTLYQQVGALQAEKICATVLIVEKFEQWLKDNDKK